MITANRHNPDTFQTQNGVLKGCHSGKWFVTFKAPPFHLEVLK